MSFIEMSLQRRSRSARPQVEVLEERQCLSVAAPTGMQLAALSPSQVKVTWNDVAGELGYRVFRWDGVTTSLVKQVAANVRTFTVTNLPANQTQWFSVEAFDRATTARSAWSAIKTPANAITAPTNLRVLGTTQTQVNLQWNFATGATGYRVYGWDGSRAVLLSTVGATVNAFTVNNLSPGSSYFFYVQSFNATNSASSAWVTALTTATQITSPGNLKATTVSANTIALSWSDSLGETGYRVYRWNGSDLTTPMLIATLSANVTGYQALGLLPGKTYSFYVQAFNVTSSANSLWAEGTTLNALPLQPPTQLVAQVDGTSSVLLSWVEPARAVGYRVFVWAGNYWKHVTTVPVGTHQASVTGLAAYTTHWFMVQAFTDGSAEVAYSNAIFVNL